MSIEAIKEALEAGPTEGPWCVDWFRTAKQTGALLGVYIAKEGDGRIAEAFCNCLVKTDEQCNANARFIAACNPVAIRSLIERLEAAEKDAARYRMERDHSRACYQNSVRLLNGIHSLLYPAPITTPDGRVMVFRPNGLDPHEIMQGLSDRIRAIPEELAKSAMAGGLAEGVSDGE